jgi:hypothetical protein
MENHVFLRVKIGTGQSSIPVSVSDLQANLKYRFRIPKSFEWLMTPSIQGLIPEGKTPMRKTILILIFPVLVILWAIGWALFNAGPQKKQKTTYQHKQQLKKQDDTVKIIGPIYEEAPTLEE